MSHADYNDLKNKTLLITGGAGILGSSISAELSHQGAKVIVLDKSPVSNHGEFKNQSDENILFFNCDVTRENELLHLSEKLQSDNIFVDVLINAAQFKSKNFFNSLQEFPLEDWNEVVNVNMTSYFLTCKIFGSLMAKRGKGSIVNVSSIYGISGPDQRIYEGSEYLGRPINTPLVYSTTKAAIVGLTKYLSTYWGANNVRVNTLTPGGIESGQNEIFQQNYSSRVPIGRMADRQEITDALLFLCSDASSYVNGHNLVVDGGWTAW